ncbi:glycosyltransferase family 1 protein [Bifidobacterium imperatoris]|uniref:Glycosyl transferase n=1 Tax=Bifidobacterium imperatoris TaxID=2020965 RepID=A0A2N5IPB4_9BIFI|nr:glycosyltransferase family 1 protein [Bifidobacterium imperatoris]PLS23809.1 glycosyl transferase [Bifidobacterium imperatoris]QSY58078.1 glycosyltransferase family 1 protein [Bifidobacterium imperatoris]
MSVVSSVQHVFVVGSKGIPGSYGGYETFVDRLTERHASEPGLKYHVACKSVSESGRFLYHNADCFRVRVPQIGPAQAIWYDVAALNECVRYIRANRIENPIVYVLACRIGPFAAHFERVIHKLGGKLYVNPDGHEWMRAKWSAPVRRYWKLSEQMMTKHADLMVCDSVNMERYIREEYAAYDPQTTFIAYGADARASELADDDPKLMDWFRDKGLSPKSYYLVVGRFVPENNYETMIREFMASSSKRDFALVTNVSDKFLEELKEKTHFDQDPRIKFVGTVYDRELLMKIREDAYAYFHGHEVGGTNPSLLEALASTDLNLLLGVGFNREVAQDAALYWSKEPGNLAALINSADAMTPDEIHALGVKAKQRIADAYSWQHIADQYKNVFLNETK